ncbi:MAG: site-specific integrase [Candidatus Thiodiazotropha lotti]|nr:site-specific integrase [Candidatus Thiodiazotropha lotti]
MPNREHPGQIGAYWLSQRKGSSAWCRTWFDKDTRQTKRSSLGTDDFQEAQLKLAEWITKNQILRKENPSELPLETVLVRYYDGHARFLRSAESARFALAKWSDFFAEKMVSDITPGSINGFIFHLREKGCSEGCIGRILGVGKAALNRAYRHGEINTVPYIKSGSKGTERERILTIPEVGALFNAVESEHMFMYLMLAFNTLARPEAILELKRFQVDIENRLIQLNPPGREQTKKRRPTLPITDALMPWLQQTKTESLVSWNGKPIKSIKKGFQRIRERAQLGSDLVPYTIRHTMATELRKRGVPAWEVAGFLGHKTEGITERYAKFSPDYLSKARLSIDDFFEELQPFVERTLVFKRIKRVSSVLKSE